MQLSDIYFVLVNIHMLYELFVVKRKETFAIFMSHLCNNIKTAFLS